MPRRLAVGLVALSLSLLGAAGPAHAAAPRVEYHDGGYCAADHDGCGDYYDDGGPGYYCADHEGCGDGNRGDKQTCFMACYITIPPGEGGGPGATDPQSLFPPSPEAIRDFVLATFKAGIAMGRLFADTTITFVTDLFVGIA